MHTCIAFETRAPDMSRFVTPTSQILKSSVVLSKAVDSKVVKGSMNKISTSLSINNFDLFCPVFWIYRKR